MTEEAELLAARVTAAWRPRDADGGVRAHPSWHDLSEADRREAFAQTEQLRAMESAADPEGLSTTAKAVLARIQAP